MSTSITIPNDYGLVILAVAASYGLTFWQGMNVASKRKAAQVPYPFLMAEKSVADANPAANIFNCAQRAHQNTLESYPTFLTSSLISGLFFPRTVAGVAAAWVAGRLLYTLAYSTGDPKRRVRGFLVSTLSQLTLLGTTVFSGYKLLTA